MFVLSVKYIPTIQLVGMLINNTLYTFDILLPITYLLDFLIGGSLVYIILGYICSITFGFCNWHRIIIAANLANSIIANIAIHANLPVTDIEFPNLTEEQLDEKIIHSAINFWFEDEDAGSGKVWNYFKNI